MDRLNTKYDKFTKIWSGPKPSNFFDADCSMGKIIFAFMRNNPNNICQISDTEGTALTNREAIAYAIRIAQHFKTMGLRQDDVVAIIGGNSTYVMPVVVGCLLHCIPFHAINPKNSEATIRQLLCVTRPKIVFCDGKVYEYTSAIYKMLKAHVYTLKHHRFDLLKIEDLLEPTKMELFFTPESLKLGGDQTVAILCTSGTTGTPKSVCLSNSACLFDFGFITGHDVILSFSTIDWPAGLFNMFFSCGHGSTRIITDAPFSAEYLVDLVSKYRVTILTLTPQQVNAIIKSPVFVKTPTIAKQKLESVRFLSVGGGSCHVPNLMKMQAYLAHGHISYGYAVTECGGVSANMGITKPHSVGKLIPGIRVKILDESGRSLGHDEMGEILVNNGKQWNGYYGNPNETKRIQDQQGWFHTGDLGYFDVENYLYVVDRKSDLLKFHGMSYWPHEIEQVVAEIPDVLEVCVFGLWNDVDGDAAAAAVVKVKGSKLGEPDVVKYVADRLIVTHKQLHCGVFFVDELPKTGSGKILRNEARDLALGKKWDMPRNSIGGAVNGNGH